MNKPYSFAVWKRAAWTSLKISSFVIHRKKNVRFGQINVSSFIQVVPNLTFFLGWIKFMMMNFIFGLFYAKSMVNNRLDLFTQIYVVSRNCSCHLSFVWSLSEDDKPLPQGKTYTTLDFWTKQNYSFMADVEIPQR